LVDDQGRIIGILSERDIVRALAKRGAAVLNDVVSMHMTAEVITTSEDECVHVAMEKMTNERSRHLPVIRNARLVGLVSTSTETAAFSIIEPEPSNATEAFLSVLMGKATGAHVRGLVPEGYCIETDGRFRASPLRKPRRDGVPGFEAGVTQYRKSPMRSLERWR